LVNLITNASDLASFSIGRCCRQPTSDKRADATMATREHQGSKLPPAEAQPAGAEQAIRADIIRHRVMKGYPPVGSIFNLPSESEVKERKAKLKRCARDLRNLLDKEPPIPDGCRFSLCARVLGGSKFSARGSELIPRAG
jgi:hypothetical protein